MLGLTALDVTLEWLPLGLRVDCLMLLQKERPGGLSWAWIVNREGFVRKAS